MAEKNERSIEKSDIISKALTYPRKRKRLHLVYTSRVAWVTIPLRATLIYENWKRQTVDRHYGPEFLIFVNSMIRIFLPYLSLIHLSGQGRTWLSRPIAEKNERSIEKSDMISKALTYFRNILLLVTMHI